jgi:hypothetical protein
MSECDCDALMWKIADLTAERDKYKAALEQATKLLRWATAMVAVLGRDANLGAHDRNALRQARAFLDGSSVDLSEIVDPPLRGGAGTTGEER